MIRFRQIERAPKRFRAKTRLAAADMAGEPTHVDTSVAESVRVSKSSRAIETYHGYELLQIIEVGGMAEALRARKVIQWVFSGVRAPEHEATQDRQKGNWGE